MAAKDGEIHYDKHPAVLKAFLDKFGQQEPMPIDLEFSLTEACFKEDVEAVKYLVPYASKTEDKVQPACFLDYVSSQHIVALAKLFCLHG